IHAGTEATLFLAPLPAPGYDLYMQVNCALAGIPIGQVAVVMKVWSEGVGGVLLEERRLVTDGDGMLCFRGVPQGHVEFAVNHPADTHRGWWHEFDTERQLVQNAKLVNIRLEPKKSAFTVDMNPPYAWMEGIPVYVQNFWIEIQGYDTEQDMSLYPARTGITDKDGKCFFERVPCLPTRITIRRPGFALKTYDIVPDEAGSFATPVIVTRPAITAGTSFQLNFDQPVFKYLSGTTSIPIGQRGLPNSNTEGFDDTWSLDRTTSLPFSATTAYGPRAPWGAGTYELFCLPLDGWNAFGEHSVPPRQIFRFAFRFPPQQVFIREGETTTHTIRAEVVTAEYHGTLFAADALSAAGEPLYRPVTNTEVRFIVHETAQDAFTPSNLMHSATTDASGRYAIALPPGIYGIEIPAMPGYWGEKVVQTKTGGTPTEYPWPAAYGKPADWDLAAYDSATLKGYGLRVDSADAGQLDLLTRLQRYHIRKTFSESGEIAQRLVFRNAQTAAFVATKDLLESQSEMILSGTVPSPVRLDDAGLFAVWTNLAAGAYSFEGSTHDYLQTQSTGQVFTCFDWGDYPGDMPDDEPPYDSPPLPMRVYDGGEASFADPDSEEATVTVLYMDGEELKSYQTTPIYVRYAEWPPRVFGYGNRVNDLRVQNVYISHSGDLYLASRNEFGNWAASTMGATANVNLSPYTLTVTARQADAQDFAVPDMPFRFNAADYTAPHQFTGITGSADLEPAPGAAGAWAWERVGYAVNITNSATEVLATIYAAPVIDLSGTLNHARTGEPVSNAFVRLLRSDGGEVRLANGDTARSVQTLPNGSFALTGVAAGFGAYVLDVQRSGYLPVRTRLVLGDLITGTNALSFNAALTQPVAMAPVGMSLALDVWDRQGAVLHGVKAGGTEQKDATAESVTLSVGVTAAITTQTYSLQSFDRSGGTPGGTEDVALNDWLRELWIVDARRTDVNTNEIPLLPATDADYYPKNRHHLPLADDPAGIEAWLRETVRNKGFYRRFAFSGHDSAAAVTGTVNVAEFPAGTVNPVLVALTGKGAATLLPLGTNRLYSVAMPRWLAFAADTLATAGALQGNYAELKETYASKQPDGKLSALPSITGGISEENGYLSYTYGLGVAWTEGNEAEGEGGLSLWPGLLGLQFEANAAIGFNGETRDLSFEVGGSVGKEEIEFTDYMPGIAKGIGVEGTINSIGGMAQTKRSGQFAGGDWREREVETSVGASFDLTLRYNLEGITGKLPYVGPFLTAADRTNLLKLYARLDAGGAVESKETWRTVELERAPVGAPNTGGYDSGEYVIRYPDLDPLTPSRHAFGGATSTDAAITNTFTLGLTFGTSFEGSALGDHLYVRAGLEITGNENDLVAGKPSLVITPNTVGDWPPVKRVEGDVNAFATAKLDVYVTEIEKTWSMNLARIDYQYTTDSLMTMTDLDILINETDRPSTTFTGTLPVLARELPRGSCCAAAGGWLAFGMYDAATRQTALVVSALADGIYGTPEVIATVEGLGLVRLADLGDGRWLLAWEEHPGLGTNPFAFSVVRAAFFEEGAWGAPQAAAALDGYLKEMEAFTTADTLNMAYVEAHASSESDEGRIRAVVFDPVGEAWSPPHNIRASSPVLGAALACVGASAGEGWSDEPGRIL
ncbi:MAG: carboxypeptidase-like regulatory domain-containing protein, partial [Kiritimatiellae bacterium]|nr:carboxypeptidase-like regulatory domain-containing protein [Kiritimatiellia bacterium]